MKVKSQMELRKVKREMSELKKRLNVLQDRKADLEETLKKLPTTEQLAAPDRQQIRRPVSLFVRQEDNSIDE